MENTPPPPPKQKQLANILRIFDLADAEAETFERRDCVRVQNFIEALRQGESEQKHILKLIETYKKDGNPNRLD
jgi:restriction endonuclease S subunit